MTLVQTGKSEMVPLVMLDVPGGTYWREWEGFVSDHLVRRGLIAPEDLSLFTVTDSIDAAIGEIERFYRVYHSSRYVHDALVLRLTAHLPPETVEALNDSFSDILTEGRDRERPRFSGGGQRAPRRSTCRDWCSASTARGSGGSDSSSTPSTGRP